MNVLNEILKQNEFKQQQSNNEVIKSDLLDQLLGSKSITKEIGKDLSSGHQSSLQVFSYENS